MARSSYYGQSADWVRHFQNWLISHGYKLPRYGADGQWGDETEAAYVAAGGPGSDADSAIKSAQTSTPTAKPTTKPATSPGGPDGDLDKYINDHYPGLAPLFKIPEIHDLLIKAYHEKWTTEELTAQFYKTNYWKSHNQTSEAWITLSPEERATERRKVAAQMISELQTLYGTSAFTKRFGSANISPDDFVVKHFGAVDGVASGKTPYEVWQVEAQSEARRTPGTQALADDLQKQEDLARQVKRPQEVAEELFQKAHGDYFVNLSKQDAVHWANNIISGRSSFGEFDDYLRKQSSSLYPFYKDSINNGVLPKALFGPALNTLASELETSTDAVIANTKLWGEITAQAAGTKGQFTASDWITYARSLPEWKRTQGAATMVGDFEQRILQEFGAIG